MLRTNSKTLAMTNEIAEMLPKTLPGVVCEQWKRCGRKNCRCILGTLHGPYYYRFWREGGHLRKAYVPREAVADVRLRCMARKHAKRSIMEARMEIRELL